MVNQYVWIRQESGEVAVEENPRRRRRHLRDCSGDSEADIAAKSIASYVSAHVFHVDVWRRHRCINLNLSMAWLENVVNVFEHNFALYGIAG